ncbi:MAG TPA: FTR1 family protein [Edaphobacter sp.]|nr:FTR1 family protein [Edaphobacter sp.]
MANNVAKLGGLTESRWLEEKGSKPWALALPIALGAVVFTWQMAAWLGVPDPITAAARTGSGSAILDIGILVFREGLECILVLAAITASMVGEQSSQRRPIAVGAGVAAIVTLATWFAAVRILDDLGESVSALNLQAATGLLAIVVLLVVMNWFFHKMYWTGWISLHNRRKRDLLDTSASRKRNVLLGLALLGFSSFYREGFEVVLFLQSYRLKLGSEIVGYGVLAGLAMTAMVAALTFLMQRKLPYKKMLVFTGILLGGVLLVMVGEQVQEMQLAHWISMHRIDWLAERIPGWMGLWFSVFPNVESLVAQAIAFVLVVGSYFAAGRSKRRAAA